MLVLLAQLASGPAGAQGFKFSQPDESDRLEQEARQSRIAEQLSTPCRAELKDKKIMVVIGERQSNGYHRRAAAELRPALPGDQRPSARAWIADLHARRRSAGRSRQAEIDAYFRNDPDATLSASKRLGASFVLRGLISSQATRNPMMAVNQVSVNMKFTLYGSNGRLISDTEASSSSYAGANVERMALTLVNEKADEVVPALYADYCRNAGPAAARKPAPK